MKITFKKIKDSIGGYHLLHKGKFIGLYYWSDTACAYYWYNDHSGGFLKKHKDVIKILKLSYKSRQLYKHVY